MICACADARALNPDEAPPQSFDIDRVPLDAIEDNANYTDTTVPHRRPGASSSVRRNSATPADRPTRDAARCWRRPAPCALITWPYKNLLARLRRFSADVTVGWGPVI
jgi:hypothetical protein